MGYRIIHAGASRSFPDTESHALLANATGEGSGLILLGRDAGGMLGYQNPSEHDFIALELGDECLGVHAGEHAGREGSNIVGFARFRLGTAVPSNLVEMVRQPGTQEAALQAARAVFEAAGLKVAVCGDFPGRIVNRLVRPYYNAALRRLDEGLASADDMDTTLRLGLGYPEGPIALLERSGLAHHHDASMALYHALGSADYLPARRAQIAKARQLAKRAA
ncbi:MAG: 3-hydroxyacyl-CoA dehydrogenase family protein [Pseudomonadota bacterium]